VAIRTISNLDYIILLCERMAKTREFYLNVMKFPLEMDRPNWVSFRVGSGLLTLRPRGAGIAWHDGPAVQGSACIQLAFRVPPPAVEEWHRELIANGVEILSPPKDLLNWRHRTLFFRDPEGNIIEIYAEI
jgi:lactoylglutathione lyase